MALIVLLCGFGLGILAHKIYVEQDEYKIIFKIERN